MTRCTKHPSKVAPGLAYSAFELRVPQCLALSPWVEAHPVCTWSIDVSWKVSDLTAIHRFLVNPSPQRHCPASLLARFFQNLTGNSRKCLQDSSWLMSSLVTENENTVKNQIAIGTIGSWCSNGITNQHWSISTYHSGRLWFFQSLQPCSLQLPDGNCDGQAIGLFDLQMSQKSGFVRLYSSVQKCTMHPSCPQLYIPTTPHQEACGQFILSPQPKRPSPWLLPSPLLSPWPWLSP